MADMQEIRFVSKARNEKDSSNVEPTCPRCRDTARLVWQKNLGGRDWWLAECRCGLFFTWPQPNLNDIRGFYADSYHVSPDAVENAFRRKFQRYVDLIVANVRPGRSLDVGCTTGLLPALLRQHGFQAEGLEINAKTAHYGAEAHGLPITIGSFEDYDVPTASFDLLTMCDVVEHTVDPVASLRKANRLLRPGGAALVTFPDILSLESRYWRALSRLFRRDWLWLNCHVPLHTWEFNKHVACNCFAAAGFSIVRFMRQSSLLLSCNEWNQSRKVALLGMPLRPLAMPCAASWLGTGMIFLLRKDHEVTER
jgi:SAM-dependent methyltransferase